MPETTSRWKISASTSGGSTASTPPAFISVGDVVVSVTNPAMMIGIVLEFSEDVNNRAYRNSPHDDMNANIAHAISPGLATGKKTRTIMLIQLHRSTRAASSRSRGMVRK